MKAKRMWGRGKMVFCEDDVGRVIEKFRRVPSVARIQCLKHPLIELSYSDTKSFHA